MSKLKITFIGHATFLIDFFGFRFLTDANFSKKIKQEPTLAPQDLPDLDALFITHAQYDHLDLPSYKYFSLKTPLIMPLGLGAFVSKHLPNPIFEITDWGEIQVGDLRVFSVPVKHQGFKHSDYTCRSSSGYVIEKNGMKILFPGDTAYGSHFKQIANLHNTDIALLPLKNKHMNPKDVLHAFHDLKAKHLIPYPLIKQAEALFLEFIQNEKAEQIHLLKPGASFELSNTNAE